MRKKKKPFLEGTIGGMLKRGKGMKASRASE
jgi:hypothetical protein